MLPQEVRPGDLITAQFMTDVLKKIRELEQRVAQLESAPHAEPPSSIRLAKDGPIHPDEWIILLGKNLGASSQSINILVDNVMVTDFDGSLFTDTSVRFRVPSFDLAVDSKNVLLSVHNGSGSASRNVQLARATVPLNAKDLLVNYLGSDPQPLGVGLPATFKFSIRNLLLNQRVDLTVSAVLRRSNNTAVDLALTDEAAHPIANGLLPLAGGKSVTLNVKAKGGDVVSLADSVQLTIGAPTLIPFVITQRIDVNQDPRILFASISGPFKANGPPASIAGASIRDVGEVYEITMPAGPVGESGGRVTVVINVEAPSEVTDATPDGSKYAYSYSLKKIDGTVALEPTSGAIEYSALDFKQAKKDSKMIIPWSIPLKFGTGVGMWQIEASRTGGDKTSVKQVKIVKKEP